MPWLYEAGFTVASSSDNDAKFRPQSIIASHIYICHKIYTCMLVVKTTKSASRSVETYLYEVMLTVASSSESDVKFRPHSIIASHIYTYVYDVTYIHIRVHEKKIRLEPWL